jgi:hypothetical protein
MKHLKGFIFLLFPLFVQSQNQATPSEEVKITGNVKNSSVFSLQSIAQHKVYTLNSLVINNHLMQIRRTIHNIKGVRIRDILEKAGLNEESPKLLSEFYFNCIATDGYKVVFSWNELFNTEVGNQVYILIESDGQKANLSGDRIAILSAADQATGRRFVKNLAEIKVERVK